LSSYRESVQEIYDDVAMDLLGERVWSSLRCNEFGKFSLKTLCGNHRFHDVPEVWFQEFVEQGIMREDSLSLMKGRCERHINAWYNFPVGSLKTDPSLPFTPTMQYPQEPGMHTCVFSSLASALHEFGDHNAAEFIAGEAKNSLQKLNRISYAKQLLCKKEWGYDAVVFKKGQLDLFNDKTPYPTVCELLGSDGLVHHAITVRGEWLFDSNTQSAIPINRDSLNWCCSSKGMVSTFVSVNFAVRFVHKTSCGKFKK